MAGWEDVGKADPVIARLQQSYGFLRPILFHSPYEAAAGFIIGQRISMKQRLVIQAEMSRHHGPSFTTDDGQELHAFPSPGALLAISAFKGLNDTKLSRLHGLADVAQAGMLTREHLLGLSIPDALAELRSIPGIGPFYASGILYRGAGIVDGVTDDDLTGYAVMKAYDLPDIPSPTGLMAIADAWRPYRMWSEVLLHIWLRREVGMPKRAGSGNVCPKRPKSSRHGNSDSPDAPDTHRGNRFRS
ncbi:MAG: hypothetical protein QM589_07715 [Thermomicrobiales bacterium]